MPSAVSPPAAEKYGSTRSWLPMPSGNSTSSNRESPPLWITYLARMWPESAQSDLSAELYLSRESMHVVDLDSDARQCIDSAITFHSTRSVDRCTTDYHWPGGRSSEDALCKMCEIHSYIADHVHSIDTFRQFISSNDHTSISSTFLIVAVLNVIIIIEIGAITIDNEKLREI